MEFYICLKKILQSTHLAHNPIFVYIFTVVFFPQYFPLKTYNTTH